MHIGDNTAIGSVSESNNQNILKEERRSLRNWAKNQTPVASVSLDNFDDKFSNNKKAIRLALLVHNMAAKPLPYCVAIEGISRKSRSS